MQYGIQQQFYNNTAINTVYVSQYCVSPYSDEKALCCKRKNPIKKNLIVLHRLYPCALCNTTSIQGAVTVLYCVFTGTYVSVKTQYCTNTIHTPFAVFTAKIIFHIHFLLLSWTIHFKMLRPTFTTCFDIKNSVYCPHTVLVVSGDSHNKLFP